MTLQEKINHAVYQYLIENTTVDSIIKYQSQEESVTRFFGSSNIEDFKTNTKDHELRVLKYSKSLSKLITEIIKNHIQ